METEDNKRTFKQEPENNYEILTAIRLHEENSGGIRTQNQISREANCVRSERKGKDLNMAQYKVQKGGKQILENIPSSDAKKPKVPKEVS